MRAENMPRLGRSGCIFSVYAFVLMLIVTTTLWLSNDRNWAALFDSERVINDRGAFGIRIGDTETHVRSRLSRQGLEFFEMDADVTCVTNRLAGSSAMEVYLDSGWRGGVVCVGYRNGRVSQIGWYYTAFAL